MAETPPRPEAIFSWRCPTYGCRGLIITEVEPGHATHAWCEAPFNEEEPFCGRPMRWSVLEERWVPVGPFQGFQPP